MRWLGSMRAMLRTLFFLLFVGEASQVRADDLPRPPWKLRVAWWNDAFTGLPPWDDSGFTNDFELEAATQWHKQWVGIRAFYRIITATASPDGFFRPIRRWDAFDILATWDAQFQSRQFQIDTSLRTGPTLSGNWGGRKIQNGWHELSETGPTIEDGLQYFYDGDRRAALLVGAEGQIQHVTHNLKLFVGGETQYTLGSTGVRFIGVFAGASTLLPVANSKFRIGGSVAVQRFASPDPNLQLPGAYGTTGLEASYQLTVGWVRGFYEFSWTYRANESGSGEPTALLSLQYN